MKLCSVENCNQKHEGYGYCNKHYKQFKKQTMPSKYDQKVTARNKRKRIFKKEADKIEKTKAEINRKIIYKDSLGNIIKIVENE